MKFSKLFSYSVAVAWAGMLAVIAINVSKMLLN